MGNRESSKIIGSRSSFPFHNAATILVLLPTCMHMHAHVQVTVAVNVAYLGKYGVCWVGRLCGCREVELQGYCRTH